MGNNQTVHQMAPAQVSWLVDKLEHHTLSFFKLASLSYEEFHNSIAELNKISDEFATDGGKKLIFSIKSGTDSTLLWKATVRIRCTKTESDSETIESSRILNLKQFIRLYKEIIHQTQASLQTECAMSASQILSQVDDLQKREEQSVVDECCICMDRKADNILPCAHSYCEQCIKEWNVSHTTCPVCRADSACGKDSWLLTDVKPDDLEVRSALSARVLGLVDKVGRPVYSQQGASGSK